LTFAGSGSNPRRNGLIGSVPGYSEQRSGLFNRHKNQALPQVRASTGLFIAARQFRCTTLVNGVIVQSANLVALVASSLLKHAAARRSKLAHERVGGSFSRGGVASRDHEILRARRRLVVGQ